MHGWVERWIRVVHEISCGGLPVFSLLFLPWGSSSNPRLLLPRLSPSHPLTGRRLSLMKASKHRPGCPQGGSLDVLLPRLNLGNTMSGRSHPSRLRRRTFACGQLRLTSPAQVCDLRSGQAKHIGLPASRAPLPFTHSLLSLPPGIPALPQTHAAKGLGKAHQAPLFIECPQCIGLKPNAELDYCT